MTRVADFLEERGQQSEHAWKQIEGSEYIQAKCELTFLHAALEEGKSYPMDTLNPLLKKICEKSRARGLVKAREAQANELAKSLKGGAGAAHKLTAIDSALPPLRLFIEMKKKHLPK